MSIRIMSLVWDKAPYRDDTLLTFLALADHCDEQGRCWPKIENLAQKSRQSKRNVIRCLQRMKLDGYISWDKEGRNNTYLVNIEKLRKGDIMSHDNLSPISKIGDIGDMEKVTLATQIGDIGDIVIRKNHQEPSIEPSERKSDCLEIARAVLVELKATDIEGKLSAVLADQARYELVNGASEEVIIESMIEARLNHIKTVAHSGLIQSIGKFYGEGKWKHFLPKTKTQDTGKRYEESEKLIEEKREALKRYAESQ